MAIQHRNAATHSERLASLEKGGEKKKKKEHVSREIKSPCNVGEGTNIEYNTKSNKQYSTKSSRQYSTRWWRN